MKKFASVLPSLPLFNNISVSDLHTLIQCSGSQMKTYKKGEILFLENEYLNWAGVVITGEVHLTQENLQGARTLMLKLMPGELFGESYACGSIKESRMVVVAASTSTVLLMPYARIQRQCTQKCPFHHQLIENMGIMLADKNVRLMERMQAISQRTLREKILVYLTFERDMYKRHPLAAVGKSLVSAHGEGWFTIIHNRTQLAEHLCADRTALARELTAMKAEGLIDFDGSEFTILQN